MPSKSHQYYSHTPRYQLKLALLELIPRPTITGSTIALTCCKGDCQSQWKTPIYGPSQIRNPLTDFDKIWNRW